MANIIKSLQKQYSGKKVLVVGLGLQGGGAGVAKFFAELGAVVTVTDKKTEEQLADSIKYLDKVPITFHLGGHQQEDFINTDMIFKGPSVPWDLPEIVAAEKKGIPVEMELSFFAANSLAKIIGITGTRGKSTTTQMIFTLLQNSNYPVYLAGSLPGISTINLLKTLKSTDWVVMELPSWPLSGFHRKMISPHIAVFTNFYPDHLNYYKNMDDYLYDKEAIFMYQREGDFLIINKNWEYITDSSTQFLSHESLTSTLTGLSEVKKIAFDSSVISFSADDFPAELQFLKGEHNKENAAAALAVGKVLGLDVNNCINIISQFKGLPFRQEIVGQKDNVIFVNDTTSTTPVATIKALDTFTDKPVYLMLGGQGKNLPYDALINQLIKAKKIILLKGSFTDEILPLLKEKYADMITPVHDDMRKAVAEAYRLAKNDTGGAYVLFSPGATSFAMYDNEFHRGREFNKIVHDLIQ